MKQSGRTRIVLTHMFLIFFTILTLYPVMLVVKKSLTPGDHFERSLSPVPTKVTLDHYKAVIGSKDSAGRSLFGRQLLNSLVVALATTLVGMFLAATAAYAFSRFRFPGSDPYWSMKSRILIPF